VILLEVAPAADLEGLHDLRELAWDFAEIDDLSVCVRKFSQRL
jgi:hypothetical protein